MSGPGGPGFWWRPAGWQARVLRPAAALYGSIAGRRLASGPRATIDAPVLCVGNFTAGGAGKTPTALALGDIARSAGRRPGFLSRGHGGTAKTALLIDTERHGADETGDEPQLLAAVAPTVVSRERASGARRLLREGHCDFVVMDDGFQSARLRVDLALVVVDGRRGLGNGLVLPAGPLRAPLELQLAHADAVLIVGEGAAGEHAATTAIAAGLPVHRAHLAPRPQAGLVGPPLLAFAGIADPQKFYRSLREIGAEIAETRDFADHHPFRRAEIEALLAEARTRQLTLVTTAKDAARLRSSPEGRALLNQTRILDIDLVLEGGVGEALIARTMAAFDARRP